MHALLLMEEDILQIYYSKCYNKLIFSSKCAKSVKKPANSSARKATSVVCEINNKLQELLCI